MYLSINLENIITVGVILLIWMIGVHLAGQLSISLPTWLPGARG
jgi:hypothetical protein